MKIDPATLSIIVNALHGAGEEMGINLMKSARSTIIREARDFSCALLDPQARLIAQAEHAPIQMASLSLPLLACLERHPVDTLRPGDVFFTNDPYRGGQHLQDLTLFLPVFLDERVVGFAGSIAHHVDIGGGAPGLTLDAADIFAEGLRFSSLKVDRSDFAEGGFVHAIAMSNFREPKTSIGDLRAQLAACTVGAERLSELFARYGVETVEAAIEGTLDRSETLMRNAISEIPDGVYRASDAIDADVLNGEPVKIQVRVEISGSEATIDFTGTDPQTRDFLNVPLGASTAAVYSAMIMTAVETGRRIPANSGCYRPLTIIAPLGTVLNPTSPAAVRARMCGAYRAFDSVLLALQSALPESAPALGFNVNTTVGFSRQTESEFRIFIEDIGGGWGATSGTDGQEMADAPLSNCKITPVEVLEADHPYLRLTRYELLPDSGGAGRFRGGLGSVREYLVLADGVQFFAYGDRHDHGPRGNSGGSPGAPGVFSVIRDGNERILPSKTAVEVRAGDLVRVIAGGGGGFGPPDARDPAALQRDLENGHVTARRGR